MSNFAFFILMAATAYLCYQGMAHMFHKAAAYSNVTRTWPVRRQLLFWLALFAFGVLAMFTVLYHILYAGCYLLVIFTGGSIQ